MTINEKLHCILSSDDIFINVFIKKKFTTLDIKLKGKIVNQICLINEIKIIFGFIHIYFYVQ